jgi:hypothetical protein
MPWDGQDRGDPCPAAQKAQRRHDDHGTREDETMLAAGGLLILVAMGYAVSGMMAVDDPGEPEDGEDALLHEADGGADAGQMTATSDLGDMLVAADPQDHGTAGLPDETGHGWLDDDWLDADPAENPDGFAALSGSDGDDAPPPWRDGVATGAEADDEPGADAGADWMDDDLACITDFEHGTDRLILEFDGSEDDAPEIGFDFDSVSGATLVLANGVPAAMVLGVGAMGPDDVVVMMSGAEESDGPDDATIGGDDAITGVAADETIEDWAEGDMMAGDYGGGDLDGGDGEDTVVHGARADAVVAEPVIEMVEIAGHVADFEPGRDVIEVIFDPDLTPDPIVTVEDFDDGNGANILFEGQLILRVSGAQGLDPALIELHEVAAQAVPEMA